MMSYLPALLPASALDNFVASPHCTLAVSNLPGPQIATKVKGFNISNIVFWLPNRGSTGLFLLKKNLIQTWYNLLLYFIGIGVSVLSYANKLQIGIIVDKAIIDNCEDANFLLENTIEEIQNMAAMTRLYSKRNSIGEIIRPADFYIQ